MHAARSRTRRSAERNSSDMKRVLMDERRSGTNIVAECGGGTDSIA